MVKAAEMQELWLVYEQRRGHPSRLGRIKHQTGECDSGLLISVPAKFCESPVSFHRNISLWKHIFCSGFLSGDKAR